MIATTKKGLVVTRLINKATLLLEGERLERYSIRLKCVFFKAE